MAETQQRARLKSRYEQEIRPALIERFGYSTPMQAPAIRKITLNMGVGDAKQDTKVLEAATEQLATIAGQRPSVRRARKSIAAFKLREGMPVGVSVTLRGERSYEFLDRLMSVAIPRIRDFRGMNPRSFDGRGNYSLGVREQIIFPEIDYDTIDQTRGLDITITTSAATDLEAFVLLEAFGFPFAAEGRPAGASAAPATDGAADASAPAAAVETAVEEPAAAAAAAAAAVEKQESATLEAVVELEADRAALDAVAELEETVTLEAVEELEADRAALEAAVELEESVALEALEELEADRAALEAVVELEESAAPEAVVALEAERAQLEAVVERDESAALGAVEALEESVALEAAVELAEAETLEAVVELEDERASLETVIELEEESLLESAGESPVESVEEPGADAESTAHSPSGGIAAKPLAGEPAADAQAADPAPDAAPNDQE